MAGPRATRVETTRTVRMYTRAASAWMNRGWAYQQITVARATAAMEAAYSRPHLCLESRAPRAGMAGASMASTSGHVVARDPPPPDGPCEAIAGARSNADPPLGRPDGPAAGPLLEGDQERLRGEGHRVDGPRADPGAELADHGVGGAHEDPGNPGSRPRDLR